MKLNYFQISQPGSAGSHKQGPEQPSAELSECLLRKLFNEFLMLEEKLAVINREKADLFSSVKTQGLNAKAARSAFRQALKERLNPEATSAHDALTATYLAALRHADPVSGRLELEGENTSHTRARTHARTSEASGTDTPDQERPAGVQRALESDDVGSSTAKSAPTELNEADVSASWREPDVVPIRLEVPAGEEVSRAHACGSPHTCETRTADRLQHGKSITDPERLLEAHDLQAAPVETAPLKLDHELEHASTLLHQDTSHTDAYTRTHARESGDACVTPNTRHEPAQSSGNGQSQTSAAVALELDHEPEIPGLPATAEASRRRGATYIATRAGQDIQADPTTHPEPRQSAGDGQGKRSSSTSPSLEDEPEIPEFLWRRNREIATE